MESAVRDRAMEGDAHAVANGRVREPHPHADPSMTHEVRQARAAWRQANFDAWLRELEQLDHHDPEYAYDVCHEYEDDWTTDPDYGEDGVDLDEFDEDGMLIVPDDRAEEFQLHMRDAARDTLGNRVEIETQVRYLIPGTGFRRRLRRVKRVKPDLMVLPRALELPPEEELDPDDKPDRTFRLDEGDPAPELVLEVVSEGGAKRDLDDKPQVYAYLGVSEYLVYDLGGKRAPGSDAELLMFRLAGETYRKLAPDTAMSSLDNGVDAYWSDVFGTHIRIRPHRWHPRFQWYDKVQGRWRDRETDREHEWNRIRQEGEARGVDIGSARTRKELAVTALHEFLGTELNRSAVDRVEAAWQRNGPPEDHLQRIRAVLRNPGAWQSLL